MEKYYDGEATSYGKSSPQSSVGVEEIYEKHFGTNQELGYLPHDKESVIAAMTEYSSLMNKEKDREIEELKFGIENFIKWLEEHRPNVAGLGAPIHILKELLNK